VFIYKYCLKNNLSAPMKLSKLYEKAGNSYYNKGFTLIELLVATIIIGVLAAIATPSLLGNIGKSRESEAKVNLGSLSRSQQAYHYENQIFADTMAKLTSNVSLNTGYYTFPDPSAAPSYDASKINILIQHEAVPIDADNKFVIKNYASGVYFDATSSNFNTIICQGQGLNQTVAVPTTTAGSCTNSGKRIK
jgi:type IV pilus assembly protein PilA